MPALPTCIFCVLPNISCRRTLCSYLVRLIVVVTDCCWLLWPFRTVVFISALLVVCVCVLSRGFHLQMHLTYLRIKDIIWSCIAANLNSFRGSTCCEHVRVSCYYACPSCAYLLLLYLLRICLGVTISQLLVMFNDFKGS
jgi:hypothetical protein